MKLFCLLFFLTFVWLGARSDKQSIGKTVPISIGENENTDPPDVPDAPIEIVNPPNSTNSSGSGGGGGLAPGRPTVSEIPDGILPINGTKHPEGAPSYIVASSPVDRGFTDEPTFGVKTPTNAVVPTEQTGVDAVPSSVNNPTINKGKTPPTPESIITGFPTSTFTPTPIPTTNVPTTSAPTTLQSKAPTVGTIDGDRPLGVAPISLDETDPPVEPIEESFFDFLRSQKLSVGLMAGIIIAGVAVFVASILIISTIIYTIYSSCTNGGESDARSPFEHV